METNNVLLIIIVGLLIFYFKIKYTREKCSSSCKNNNKKYKKKKSNKLHKLNDYDYLLDDINSFERINSIGGTNDDTSMNIKKGFIDVQYHPDYQDLLNAIGLLIPYNKQIFNIPNIPVTFSNPDNSVVDALLKDFTKKINDTIALKVSIPTKPADGWENYQKSLGLSYLYENDTNKFKKGVYKLVGINDAEKFSTENEVKYIIQFIMQKDCSNDQVILKVHFVEYKFEELNEDNFFKKINSADNPIRIEHIYIIGFLTDKENEMTKQFDPSENLYHFDDMEKQHMTDPKEIQEILKKKYTQKMMEMEARTSMFDEDGQIFDLNLTNKIHRFPSYQTTRTIFDDFDGKPDFE